MSFRGTWDGNFTQYNIGDRVDYEGQKYEIIQAHTSEPNWSPPATPALWRHVDNNSGGQQSSYQPAPQQSGLNQAQPDGQVQGGYTTDNGLHVPHEDTTKHWYDLDDNKKNLLLGGGLAVGLAALGGTYYHEHEKHKKSGEDEKAQAWELQNWIMKARNQTAAFLRNGPQAPTSWIFNDALQGQPRLFSDLIVGGEENGEPWYIARAYHNGGLQIGKYRPNVGAYIGYSNEAILVKQCEVLIGSFSAIRWVRASGHLDAHKLGARPVEGGQEANGELLFIAKAEYKGGVHPGKASAKLGGAFITYGKHEESIHNYEVLCYL